MPPAEERQRLSQSKGYRMVPLSGIFTVESGGVFVPQNLKRAYIKGGKNLIGDFKVKIDQSVNQKELIPKSKPFRA